MDNLYLFIIWNSALFARDIIKKDIEQDFETVLDTFVNWKNTKYEENLKAFYGRKISNVQDKINIIKQGPFNVIVVKDNNPEFGYRKTNDGEVYVNTRIFDKKILYRKYTGGSFRIHNSIDDNEFKHDMVVLFGSDFKDLLVTKKNNYDTDTKTVQGFSSKEDLLECLKLFGNNKAFSFDNELIIFAKYRLDIERFIGNIENINYTIYGEEEGDIPSNMMSLLNDEMIKDFKKVKKEYDEYQKTGLLTNCITSFFEKYGLKSPERHITLRENEYPSLKIKMKRIIKYTIAKIKYGKK